MDDSATAFLSRLLPTTNPGDPVGLGLYWAVNCNYVIAEMYPEMCAKNAPVGRFRARLKLKLGYYVYNATDAYLNSTENYLEDVAILELIGNAKPDRHAIRPACVPKPDDVFEHSKDEPPFTLAAKRAVNRSSKYIGKYEQLGLTELVALTAAGDDTWQAGLCEDFEDKIKCVTVPYGAGDFWLLPGVGVFGKVKGSEKWHLYGHVIEVLTHNERKHYHVVIRLIQSLLTDICYYAGVCANEEVQENSGNTKIRRN
ncbi:hypothetical protein AAVH_25607 [Aphelenchoides avenae]|nr:hypothetical protein AAVH_25607 [Aphelenchus avenae]